VKLRKIPHFPKELEETLMLEVILKRFEKPDEVRTFEKGKFELLQVGAMTIGRATYEPGWKWSVHVVSLGTVTGKDELGNGKMCLQFLQAAATEPSKSLRLRIFL
jgi:hypothetical protein